MRQRDPQAGPVQLRRLRRSAVHVGCGDHARSCSSAWTLSALARLLFGRSRGRHDDAHLLFLDARSLAGELPQIVELCATHTSAAHDGDVRDHRAVHRENALDADAVRDFPYREAVTDAAAAPPNAHALEVLD